MFYRRIIYVFVALFILVACQAKVPEQDKALEPWIDLLDNASLDAWQSSSTADMIPLCWKMQNDELQSIRVEERPENAHASLLTKKQYSDFELAFDFKLEAPTEDKDTNSGIKYFVYPGTELGLEYQLYATLREIEGPHAIADLYDILPAHDAELKPFDEWNSGRIISKGKTCEHWLNGKKVLEFERGSDKFRAGIAQSKFKDRENFGELPAGHIMLQDHGGGIKFRNVKIR